MQNLSSILQIVMLALALFCRKAQIHTHDGLQFSKIDNNQHLTQFVANILIDYRLHVA